ncbi:MAG TPA: hypothetical protein ENI85_04300 [Deltaproteobacteria bacterium]|nr:hypothetical protein [Deltaproteobacteria bacterium]
MMRFVVIGILSMIVGAFLGYQQPGERDRMGLSESPSAEELETAVSDALQDLHPTRQRDRIARLAQKMTAENAGGAIRAIEDRIGVTSECTLKPLMSAYARIDPDAAFSAAMGWDLWSKRVQGGAEVARSVAARGDPDRALALAASVSVPKTVEGVIGGAITGWVQAGSLDRPTKYLQSLPVGTNLDDAIDGVLATLYLKGGIEEIMNWVDSIPMAPSVYVRKRSFGKALHWVANRDPLAAAEWYERNRQYKFARVGPSIVVTEWMEHDPEAATAWLLSQPDDGLRSQTFFTAGGRLVANDPSAAYSWALHLEPAEEVDRVLMHVADSQFHDDPSRSLELASKITNQAKKHRYLYRTLRKWQTQSPEEAAAWLARHELPETVARRLAQSSEDDDVPGIDG